MAEVSEAPVTFEHAPVAEAVRAKLFMHGGSQAVRLPKAFRFEGKEVRISRDGDRVILEAAPERRATPKDDKEWAEFWARIDALRGPELIPYPPRDDIYFESEPE